VSPANRASFNSNEPSLYSVELEFESSLVERVSSELSSVSAHLQALILFQFYIKKFYIFLWCRMSPMLNGGTFEEIYRFLPLFLGYLLWWPIH
jgi:hypothetical protein